MLCCALGEAEGIIEQGEMRLFVEENVAWLLQLLKLEVVLLSDGITATAVGLVAFLPLAMAIFLAAFFFADLLLQAGGSSLLLDVEVIISGVEMTMMPRRGLLKVVAAETAASGETTVAIVIVGEPVSPGGVETLRVLRLLSSVFVSTDEVGEGLKEVKGVVVVVVTS